MTTWQTQFLADGGRAVEQFRVLQAMKEGPSRYVVAEADTGSRYVMLAVAATPDLAGTVGGPWVVVVHEPWRASYALVDGGFMDVGYFVEKLGRRYQPLRDHHGGDVYALLMCLRTVLPRWEFMLPFEAAE